MGFAEKYVRVVQKMYENSKTMAKCVIGITEGFKVAVVLNPGLAVCPFLFSVVIEV